MRRLASTSLACAALMAFGTGAAQGQTIGFKLGASLANIDVDEAGTTQERMTGFAGGGFIRFGSGMLGLQPELLSVTKGTNVVDTNDDIELRLEYVEIPVLVHVGLMQGSAFAPYLFAGPTIALEAGCSARENGVSRDCGDADVFSRNTTDFGATGGGGFAFLAGPGALLVEARYTYGFTNINAGSGPEAKNRATLLMAGYSIPLGRRY